MEELTSGIMVPIEETPETFLPLVLCEKSQTRFLWNDPFLRYEHVLLSLVRRSRVSPDGYWCQDHYHSCCLAFWLLL